MAQPSDLQTQISTIQWTNGQRQITGAYVLGLFTLLLSILGGMGTWTNGAFVANVTTASVFSALGFGPPAHVANAGALAALSPIGQSVIRDDVAALYTDTGSSCTISGGDGGWQIQPASGHCWQTNISGGASAALWGADSGNVNDNQPAWQAGVNALASVGGGTLTLPATKGCFLLKSPVVIAANNVSILGAAGGTCVDPTNPTANAFMVGGSTSTVYSNDAVRNVTFVPSVQHTAGAMVEFFQANVFTAQDIKCMAVGTNSANECIGIDYNSTTGRLTNTISTGTGQSGICIGCNGPGPWSADITIDGGNFAFQNLAAINLQFVSGLQILNLNTDYNLHGLWAHPGSGQQVDALHVLSGTFFDGSSAESVLLDSTGGGSITDAKFSGGVWIASSGSTVPSTPGYTATTVPTANCMTVNGTTTSMIDNVFDVHAFNCGGNGIGYVGGGNANDFRGTITGSGINCGGACNGLFVGGGISHWSWSGRIGGASRVSPNGSAGQKYGVQIGAGIDDYFSISGDLSGNTVGPVNDNSTGAHKNLSNVLPPVPWPPFATVVSSTGGALTTASGTLSYGVAGPTLNFSAFLTTTTNGSSAGGSLTFTLPFAPVSNVMFSARNEATGATVSAFANAGQATGYVQTATGTYPGVDGTSFRVSGSYQIPSP